jgi:hypothetical protein
MWSSDYNEQYRLIGAGDKYNGANNMAKVKQIYGWQSKYPAFKWCADLGEGWYLPAIEELKIFTLNTFVHYAVNQTLASKGKKLANKGDHHYYWSSTDTQVATVYLGDDAPADSELYCFVPYGNGQMNLFSKGMEKYVYKHKPAMGTSNYLATRLDSKASLVIATTFDINKRSFKITADGTDIQSQSSKPALKNKSSQATTWEIKLVSIEEDAEYFDQVTAIDEVVVEDGEINGNDEMYDIFGRKVTAPAKNNIYIKGNKKIIF